MDDAFAFSFDHDEPESELEVELLSDFLQAAQDWGDLSWDFEAGERVRAGYRMSTGLRALEEAGFWVFGNREIRRLEGGACAPSAFPVAILRVVRSTSSEVVRVDLDGPAQRRGRADSGSKATHHNQENRDRAPGEPPGQSRGQREHRPRARFATAVVRASSSIGQVAQLAPSVHGMTPPAYATRAR